MLDGSDSLFLPPHKNLDEAKAACTHLAVGAHPDDLEVMAGHGIIECFESEANHFFGVTCTTGAGSARSGQYAGLSDQEMEIIRAKEQKESALKGRYSGVQLLSFQSSDIKGSWNHSFLAKLKVLVSACQPRVIYTHNPFDKHLTHVSVAAHLVEALRELNYKPEKFYGCEVWRGLDWLPDSQKQALPITNPGLIAELIGCHKSQTEGGKDYAAATLGRMAANATFFDARAVDRHRHQLFAVDLLPMLVNPGLSFVDFASQKVHPFAQSIEVGLLPFCRGE